MKKVLVLTYNEDLHADYVCDHLKDIGVDFFRVNTERIIEEYNITFDSLSGLYKISDKQDIIIIDSSWNIWNRRVMDPKIPEDFPKELENMVFTETKRTWEGLLFSYKGRVVNRPQNNFSANNKIDQLVFAREYNNNIEIPQTIITNNPEDLRKFYKLHKKISHKLLKAPLVQKGEEYLTLYNTLVSEENLKHAYLIERNPSLFQKYIDKEYELRITALENKVIAIAIHSQDSEQSRIDFRRYDFDNVKYEKIDIPTKVSSFCIDMIKHYGLYFGEFDFILTKDGKYVFLELNPNGQWLWLELKSGYNLTKDIAENLIQDE